MKKKWVWAFFMLSLSPLCGFSQGIVSIAVDPPEVVIGSAVQVSIDIRANDGDSLYCGLTLSFGDGTTQSIRVESSPIRISHRYSNAGPFAIIAEGKMHVRGLRTAFPCEGSARSTAVLVTQSKPLPPITQLAPIVSVQLEKEDAKEQKSLVENPKADRPITKPTTSSSVALEKTDNQNKLIMNAASDKEGVNNRHKGINETPIQAFERKRNALIREVEREIKSEPMATEILAACEPAVAKTTNNAIDQMIAGRKIDKETRSQLFLPASQGIRIGISGLEASDVGDVGRLGCLCFSLTNARWLKETPPDFPPFYIRALKTFGILDAVQVANQEYGRAMQFKSESERYARAQKMMSAANLVDDKYCEKRYKIMN